jgi:hypothetical protein
VNHAVSLNYARSSRIHLRILCDISVNRINLISRPEFEFLHPFSRAEQAGPDVGIFGAVVSPVTRWYYCCSERLRWRAIELDANQQDGDGRIPVHRHKRSTTLREQEDHRRR